MGMGFSFPENEVQRTLPPPPQNIFSGVVLKRRDKLYHLNLLSGFMLYALKVIHEGVSKSFRTGRLERELQMV